MFCQLGGGGGGGRGEVGELRPGIGGGGRLILFSEVAELSSALPKYDKRLLSGD